MKRNSTILTTLFWIILFGCASFVKAQDVLPFPVTPSTSTAGLTMQTSTTLDIS